MKRYWCGYSFKCNWGIYGPCDSYMVVLHATATLQTTPINTALLPISCVFSFTPPHVLESQIQVKRGAHAAPKYFRESVSLEVEEQRLGEKAPFMFVALYLIAAFDLQSISNNLFHAKTHVSAVHSGICLPCKLAEATSVQKRCWSQITVSQFFIGLLWFLLELRLGKYSTDMPLSTLPRTASAV